MKDYIKIARPDHWIKNLFIVPGTLFALLLVGWKGSYGGLAGIALVSFFCTCMIASGGSSACSRAPGSPASAGYKSRIFPTRKPKGKWIWNRHSIFLAFIVAWRCPNAVSSMSVPRPT